MTATRQEMMDEAIKRMKMMRLMPQVIRDFKEGMINLSERGGLLYWLDDEEKKMVKEFEDNTGYLVYHVIKSNTSIGLMYSLLNVCSQKEEWQYDREDIKSGICMCYVKNVDMPDCSEFGSIGIASRVGGLVRTA